MPATRLTFRPPWWGSLLYLAGCALFVAAGTWQLGRMQEKRALLASFAARASLPPQTGPLSDARAAEQRFARLRVRGRYDSAHQVLLENIVHDGRPGYYVLTPLRTAGAAVLVNRGWLPANPDRSAALPALRVAETTREVSGRIEPLPVPGLRLASPLPAAGGAWPRRLLFPTAAQLGAEIGYPVHDYQLLLDPAAPDGFLRDWRPATGLGPETHLGYAVQWFGFAVAATIIYLALNLKRHAT